MCDVFVLFLQGHVRIKKYWLDISEIHVLFTHTKKVSTLQFEDLTF